MLETPMSRFAPAFCLLLFLFGRLAIVGQESVTAPSTGSQIRLELARNSVPTKTGEKGQLTIRIVNDGADSVSLPRPTEFCGDSLGGSVMIRSKSLPPTPTTSKGGTGCVAERVGHKDILADAAEWITIAPGGSYDITVPLYKAINLSPGDKYEIVVRYNPPYLTATQLSALEANGIHAIQLTTDSTPLVLEESAETEAQP